MFANRKIQFALALGCALTGSLSADTVTSGSGAFSAFPTGFGASTPAWTNNLATPTTSPAVFWNNDSYDSRGVSQQMNVGNLLTNSGGYAGSPSVLGSDRVSEDLTDADGVDPAAFNFIRSAAAMNIALLFADSSLDTGRTDVGTVFGSYQNGVFTPLYNVGSTGIPTPPVTFDPTGAGGSYGFYATVCYAVGSCETYTTGNGNWGNNTGGAGWNHFALFKTASGNYVLGFEDANGIFGEGSGDYNDLVVELSQASSVPEPGTFGILAVGIALLFHYRARRNV